MHFNNQVLKVGTFDGILFSFFFCSFLLSAQCWVALCFMQATTTPNSPNHPLFRTGVVAQVVTNWGAAIKFYN